jgi:hypothetical protein
MMPHYEMRLYKKTSTTKSAYIEVDRIPFEALDDNDAEAKGPTIQIPRFDNSDLAMLLRDDGKVIWVLKA